MSDEILQNNLVKLLNQFRNRPHHLAKYLIENKYLKEAFVKRVLVSNQFSDIKNISDMNFHDISHMNEYFNSFISDNNFNSLKSIDEVTIELNSKLDLLLKEERYEEAISIREYMIKNGLVRNNNQ